MSLLMSKAIATYAGKKVAKDGIPKTIDLGYGGWDATLMPRFGELLMEFGSIRDKSSYIILEGTISNVESKINSISNASAKSAARHIVAEAKKKMDEYRKSEQSHGRSGQDSILGKKDAEDKQLDPRVKQWYSRSASEFASLQNKVESIFRSAPSDVRPLIDTEVREAVRALEKLEDYCTDTLTYA